MNRKLFLVIGLFFLGFHTTAGAVNLLEELKSAIESSQQQQKRQKTNTPTETPVNFPNKIETFISTTEIPIEIKGMKPGTPIIEIVKNFPVCEFRSATADEKKEMLADQVGVCSSKISNCYFNKNESCDTATFGGKNIKQIAMIFKNKKLLLVNVDLFGEDYDPVLDALKQKYGVKHDIVEDDNEKELILELGFTEGEINRMRRMTRDQLKEFQSTAVMWWMNSKSKDILFFKKRTGELSMINHAFVEEVEAIEKNKKEKAEIAPEKKPNQQKPADI